MKLGSSLHYWCDRCLVFRVHVFGFCIVMIFVVMFIDWKTIAYESTSLDGTSRCFEILIRGLAKRE